MTVWVRRNVARKSVRSRSVHLRANCLSYWLLALLWLGFAPVPLAAQSPLFGEPLLISSEVNPAGGLAFTVDPSGDVALLWQQPATPQESAQVRMAFWPFDDSSLVQAPLPEDGAAGLAAVMTGVAGSWQRLTVAAASAGQVIASTAGQPQVWSADGAAVWAWALDHAGGLHVAWWSDEAIIVEQPEQGTQQVVPLSAAGSVTRLVLTAGAEGAAHLVWVQGAEGSDVGALWAVSLPSPQSPTLLAPRATLQAALTDTQGKLHVVWSDERGLVYGTGDGGLATVLQAGLTEPVAAALALGPDQLVHLVWASGGRVHYAMSADWQRSHQSVEADAVRQVAVTVDGNGLAHLAWLAEVDGAPELWLLSPPAPLPQLRMTWPEEGALVLPGQGVWATTNLALAEWREVAFYLQPVDWRGERAPLYLLAQDTRGADGWSATLPDDQPAGPVRIVALGRDRRGRVARATSGTLTLMGFSDASLMVRSATDEAAGALYAGLPGEGSPAADVFLSPLDARGAPLPGTALYAGHLALQRQGGASGAWLDTRRLPDGTFTLQLDEDAGGGARDASSMVFSAPVTVDNTRAPKVQTVRWNVVRRTGHIGLESTFDPWYRAPVRVDFYIQKTTAGLSGELMWVGSDEDPADGWSTLVPLRPEWGHGEWTGWAVGCDSRDLCGSGQSASMPLDGGTQVAYWMAAPDSGRPVGGELPVVLVQETSATPLRAVRALLERADGTLLPLGYLKRGSKGWHTLWDSRSVPDGSYRLLLEARPASGGPLYYWSGVIQVHNAQASWSLDVGTPLDHLQGVVPISVRSAAEGVSLRSANFYLDDGSGRLIWLGQISGQDPRQAVLFQTRAVLDGNYRLVADLRTATWEQVSLEAQVTVRNAPLAASWLQEPEGETVTGEFLLQWSSEPAVAGILVDLEISRDGGDTWSLIAHDRPASGTLRWDSSTVADTDAALLRVLARRAGTVAVATSTPFVIDNAAEAPMVALLWPTAGETLSGVTEVRWAARHPDGQPCTVDLLARREGREWVPVAQGLPVEGSLRWDTGALVAGDRYALRAVVRDARGQTQTDTVQNVRIVANRPPSITLVWPDRHTLLEDSTAILWQTHDPDGNRLTVDVYYSDNDGVTWYSLARNVEDVGYYVWEVSFLPPGAMYKVRVVASDGINRALDQSEGTIQIGRNGLPSLTLISPWAGSVVRDTVPVRWMAGRPVAEDTVAELLVRPTATTDWQVVTAASGEVSALLLDTRLLPDGLYDVAVRLRSGEAYRFSSVASQLEVRNGPAQPRLSLQWPRPGAVLSGWSTMRWACDRCPAGSMLDIEIRDEEEARWIRLDSVPAVDGHYRWNTDDWASGTHYSLRARLTGGDGLVSAVVDNLALGGHGLWPPLLRLDTTMNASGRSIRWSTQPDDGQPPVLTLSLCGDAASSCTVVEGPLAPTGVRTLSAQDGGRALVVASDDLYTVAAQSRWPAGTNDAGPTLRLLQPQADQSFAGSVLVAWEAIAPQGQEIRIALEYSVDGAQTWNPIISDLANIGRYLWQTVYLRDGTYRLRVTAATEAGTVQQTSAPFVLDRGAPPPNASLLADGEGLGALGSRALVWGAMGAGALPARIAVGCSSQGPWERLVEASSLAQLDGFSAAALPNAQLWLRLTLGDTADAARSVVAGPVRINSPAAPRVRLLAPQDGEVWSAPYQIAWQAMGGAGSPAVSVLISRDGGATWTTIADGLPATGTTTWEPGRLADGVLVLVRVEARSGNTLGVAELAEAVRVQPASSSPLP
ncbi:MAG: hypothetical protein ACOX2L_10055 [Anaerolineae bacterium]|jgi:hypothetical protein|nr:hypothetical protein [Chloroflexota bacterium]